MQRYFKKYETYNKLKKKQSLKTVWHALIISCYKKLIDSWTKSWT